MSYSLPAGHFKPAGNYFLNVLKSALICTLEDSDYVNIEIPLFQNVKNQRCVPFLEIHIAGFTPKAIHFVDYVRSGVYKEFVLCNLTDALDSTDHPVNPLG